MKSYKFYYFFHIKIYFTEALLGIMYNNFQLSRNFFLALPWQHGKQISKAKSMELSMFEVC